MLGRSLRCFTKSPVFKAKKKLTYTLKDAKKASGKTYDQIAAEIGLTNAYTASLFLGQAQLKPGTVDKLRAAVPALTDEQIERMQQAPMRGWDEKILQEPNVYRTYEAVTHYGEAIKEIINEQLGDGIMSAIDFYLDVGHTTGVKGEKRVVITFNGKFLPHIEQQAADNTAPGPRD
eukprot:TRINITY_DN38257_c0_g1_i1.p1 TRINITY_DN38257_c0_g1~~TRINITY_DN38257_c0_g1_i1.p1  ORF type:complete len:176 (-),score=37.52 TRINITY_DN38257_c0_g1_i1:102-629(-)